MHISEIENENKNFIKEVNKDNNKSFINQLNLLNIGNFYYNNFINMKKVPFYKFFILFIFINYFIYSYNKENLLYKEEIKSNELFKKSKDQIYLKVEIVKKFNSFIKLCHKGNLIDKTKYPLLKNPKISVIMPIFNGGKYLKYSLRSIQNQKMKDIEIILIDDCSTDDSIITIKKYIKEDPRIKLIENRKNKKILYSKSIAALNSNGKYIIQLDQDDMFIRDDLFNILYLEAEKYDLDLVQIRDFIKTSFFFKKKTRVNCCNFHYIYPKTTHYKKQPELKDKLFTDQNNYLLWGLLIKTDLYKKVIYILWPFIMNYKLIFNEDYIITFMIVILSSKYKYINKFGLIHLIHPNSVSNEFWNNKEYYLCLYFFLDYLYKYHLKENPEDIKILLNYIALDNNSFVNGVKLFPKLFEYNFKRILNNDYLTIKEKNNIINKFNISQEKLKEWDSYEYLINTSEYISILNFQNYILDRNNKNNKGIIDNRNISLISIEKQSIFFQKNYINNSILYINKKQKESTINNYKISIVLFCNEIKFLEKTIYSILNQTNINYEIIIINDNNDKINLNYMKKYIEINENIKLIKNNKRKGLMYSFSVGILISKGEYILLLLCGYTISKSNILLNLYNISSKENLDIIEFNLLINRHHIIKNNSLNLYKCIHFKSEIKMKSIKFNEQYREIDQEKDLLFNKLIKANIYKNIIYKHKFYKYNETIYNYFDNILIFLINRKKVKFKHINIFGLIQNLKDINLLELRAILNDKIQKRNDAIFYINFLFDNTENKSKDKKYALIELINLLSSIFNKSFPILKNSIKLIEKFMNCMYISKDDKIELKFLYNSLIN